MIPWQSDSNSAGITTLWEHTRTRHTHLTHANTHHVLHYSVHSNVSLTIESFYILRPLGAL